MLISAKFFEVVLDAFIIYIQKSWTPKNLSVDRWLGTTVLAHNQHPRDSLTLTSLFLSSACRTKQHLPCNKNKRNK